MRIQTSLPEHHQPWWGCSKRWPQRSTFQWGRLSLQGWSGPTKCKPFFWIWRHYWPHQTHPQSQFQRKKFFQWLGWVRRVSTFPFVLIDIGSVNGRCFGGSTSFRCWIHSWIGHRALTFLGLPSHLEVVLPAGPEARTASQPSTPRDLAFRCRWWYHQSPSFWEESYPSRFAFSYLRNSRERSCSPSGVETLEVVLVSGLLDRRRLG